jgi:hypothetical protein
MLRSNFSADTSVDDHCQHLTFIHLLPDASKCPNTMVLHFARICKHVIYSSAVYTTILYMSSCQSFSQSRCIHLWGTSNRVFIDGVEPQQVQVRQLWAGPNIWMRIAMSRWRTIAHDKTMCKIRTEPLKAVLVHRLHLTEQGVGTQQKLWRSTQEVWKVESTGCCHNLRPVHCRGLRSQRKGR